SSTGNDANDGRSEAKAKRTIASAFSQLRTGFPDWMLLKTGDVFTENLPTWRLAGRSPQEPMLVSSYGTSPDRPTIQTGNTDAMQGLGTFSNIAFVGLHFTAHTWTGATSGGPAGLYMVGNGSNILIEGCMFERYANHVLIQGWNGRVNGAKLRRNVFLNP